MCPVRPERPAHVHWCERWPKVPRPAPLSPRPLNVSPRNVQQPCSVAGEPVMGFSDHQVPLALDGAVPTEGSEKVHNSTPIIENPGGSIYRWREDAIFVGNAGSLIEGREEHIM